MKMKIMKTYSLLLCILITSCNLSDDIVNLPGGYQLIDEGVRDRAIIGPHNINPDITQYGYNTNFILVEQQLEDGVFISQKAKMLINVFDDIANTPQSKRDSLSIDSMNVYKTFLRKGAKVNGDRHKNVVIGFEIADSIVHDPIYQQQLKIGQVMYYIINLHSDELIGPLTKEEYQRKRKELNIPETLQMHSADN